MKGKFPNSRGAAAVLGLFVLAAAPAQQNPPAKPQPAPLAAQQITKSLYLVKGGSGANAGFYMTKKEIFVIDAKMSPDSAAEMLGEIAKVSPAPVTTIILTHSDGDHINGLPGFPMGLRIISHGNCRSDVESAAANLPALKDFVPNRTFDKKARLYKGRDGQVELLHFGPAHTSGDTVVWFPRERAVFVGDLVFMGRDPLIHRNKGGNSFGYVATLKEILRLRPAVQTFLSGHADPVGREDIAARIKDIEDKQARVRALVAEGKSLEEVKRALGVEEPPAKPGGRRWMSLAEVIYRELTEK